jgi:hypothetical protein
MPKTITVTQYALLDDGSEECRRLGGVVFRRGRAA